MLLETGGRESCQVAVGSLGKLFPAQLVNDPFGHGVETVPKQSVEGEAWFLLSTSSKM